MAERARWPRRPTALTAATTVTWCASCRAETLFERPDCGEGHGSDCPEWACVVCGEAVMRGFELADPIAR